MLNIIGTRKLWYLISMLTVGASFAALAVWGLRLGIDFTGGSLLEVEFTNARPQVQDMRAFFEAQGEPGVVQPASEKGYIVRTKHLDEAKHQEILKKMREAFGKDQEVQEHRFETVGPTVSAELRRKSLYAIGLVCLFIVLYIAFAFRKASHPVSSWKYGIVAVVALIHDVAIPTGVFAALGHFRDIEVDTLFVTALLTILGFSVHDTIVVFDRIRENILRARNASFADIVNTATNQTISRSINTSLTTLLALLAVLFFGGETTRYFALALSIGIVVGTYSSIFLASPLLVTWCGWRKR